MSSDDRLAELERKIQYLTDRQEIFDCIARLARANDRFDLELHASCYHPDGYQEIASTPVPGPQAGNHHNAGHERISDANLHHVTTHLCEIDGDVAHAESYVIGMFLDKEVKRSRILSGRYLDRLEKRNGEWKIALRRGPVEIVLEGRADLLNMEFFRKRGYLRGSRGPDDLSYTRPFTLEGGERWPQLPEADS
jgi:hypothetical protein